MPIIPQPISSLPSGVITLNTLFVAELPSGQEISCTLQDILSSFSIPSGLMSKSVYDTADAGVVDDSQRLGGQKPSYYLDLGNMNANFTAGQITALQGVFNLSGYQLLTQKDVPGGYAGLDSNGKISINAIPLLFNYVGSWDAGTNTPTLADNTGVAKTAYIVSVAGTQNLGSGSITFDVGNLIVHNGSVWELVPTTITGGGVTDIITEAGSETGTVDLSNNSKIGDSAGRRYATDNQKDAMDNAATPSSSNPFATMSDIAGINIYVSLDIQSPERYGATHSTDTFADRGYNQSYINANYAGIGAVTTDVIDWAAIQKCYQVIGANDGVVEYGNYRYYTNKPVTWNKYAKRILNKGNFCTIQTVNNNAFSVIGTPEPTDQNDANVIIAFQSVVMENFNIEGGSNQVGINPSCQFGSEFNQIRVYNCGTGFWNRFMLNATYRQCYASLVTSKGFLVDKGNWSGATVDNSNSHHTELQQCRVDVPSGGISVAFANYYNNNVKFENCITEGAGACSTVFDVVATNTTATNMSIINTRFECLGGGGTLLKANTLGMEIIMDGAYVIYPILFADCTSLSGTGFQIIKNTKYAVPQAGKFFRNNNTCWLFQYNEQFNALDLSSWFIGIPTGVVPAYCAGAGCGYNTYSVLMIR